MNDRDICMLQSKFVFFFALALVLSFASPTTWAHEGHEHVDPKDVPRLIAQLKADDADLQTEAAHKLANVNPTDLGGAAVSPLVSALKDNSPEVQRSAAYALGILAGAAKKPVPELRALLEHKNTSVRVRAAEAMLKLNDKEVYGEIAYALLSSLTYKEKLYPEEVVSFPSTWLAASLFMQLRTLPRGVISDYLQNLSPGKQKPLFTEITKALQHKKPLVKQAALLAVFMLKDSAANLANEVASIAATDEDGWTKFYAFSALKELGPSAERSFSAIEPLVFSDDQTTRELAVSALAAIGANKPKATVHVLIRALDDPVLSNRKAVLKALASFGPKAAPAISKLKEHLADKTLDPLYHEDIRQTLKQIESK